MNLQENKIYLKIAWRSIIRNKRKTSLTVLSILFGVVSLILFGGYVESTYDGLRESTIHSRLGHIQITKKGYREKGSLNPSEYSIKNYLEIKNKIANIKEIEFITKRVEIMGILATDNASVNFIATGVDPEIDKKINTFVRTIEGSPPLRDKPFSVSIGSGLAGRMEIKPGDDITLMSSYGAAGLNAIDYSVSGIFESGIPDYDNTAVTIPIKSAWELLGTGDVHKIILMLNETKNTEKVLKKLKNIINKNRWELEIKTWEDLAGFYQKVKDMFGTIFGFIVLVVVIIVVFSIANTITMSVYERTREIGSNRAIGADRKGIALLFLFEGVYIGLIGGIIGITLGAALSLLLSNIGIIMPPPPGMTIGYPLQILIVPSLLLKTFFLAVITSVVSSIIPARKAAKLNIVEALRHV